MLLPLAVVAGCGPAPAAPVTATSPDPVQVTVPGAVAPPSQPETVEPRGPSGQLPLVSAVTAATIARLTVIGTPLQELGGVARAVADVGGIRRYMLLARVATNRIAALDARCTHEGCTVDRFSAPLFECPCHGSQFDWTGQVRRGPAPAALPSLTVEFDGAVARIVL